MAALAGAWAREVAADAWPGPVNEGAPRATRLFVAGGATHAGKSTVCLGILQTALEKYGASNIAYVKAATQDEREDTVSRWCAAHKVEYRSGKQCPIVYYAGFTRAFLDGSAGTSQQWLDRVASVVDDLAQNRKFVLVDGVGFPAVGSICGTSNADVAKRLEAPVVLVVKAGVGAAIDEANYGTAFFGSRDVPVLGVVLNRSASQGFYAREKILAPVHAYFAKTRLGLYGVIPDEPSLTNLRNEAASKDIDTAPVAAHVRKHVDVDQLMSDAARDPWNSRRAPPSSTAMDAIDAEDLRLRIQQAAAQLGAEVVKEKC